MAFFKNKNSGPQTEPGFEQYEAQSPYEQQLSDSMVQSLEVTSQTISAHEANSLATGERLRGTGANEGVLVGTLSAYNEHLGFTEQSVTDQFESVSDQLDSMLKTSPSDAGVWQKAQTEFDQWANPGTRSRHVTEVLDGASSKIAAQAMRVALDKRVWQKAQTEFDQWANPGTRSRHVTEVLDGASSKIAAQAMQLGVPYAHLLVKSEQQSQREHDGSHNTDGRDRNLGANAFRGFQQDSEQTAAADTTTEARRLMDTVVPTLGREFGWLNSAAPADVQRVINTVRRLRETAHANGKEITDRQIFVKYHAAAQMSDPKPTTLTSYKILQALMKGDTKGKIPF